MKVTPFRRFVVATSALALGAGLALPVAAQGADEVVLQAREALRLKDRARLASTLEAAVAAAHPLASWTAYGELSNRLSTAQQPELDAFYTRWPATYVEDRLRQARAQSQRRASYNETTKRSDSHAARQ